jgi:hypothetical protein
MFLLFEHCINKESLLKNFLEARKILTAVFLVNIQFSGFHGKALSPLDTSATNFPIVPSKDDR